ncbi:MAG: hypothetical protein PHC28_09210 [Flavobacterium sp.]|uniref:hypothetical protein n=1 Tax=Flavobacterium sp. TaxID=239 RepID=UPI0026179D21|nr:hypothetical protein [Flavobacterium sp.]MDD5150647.1 hypothetical protein [Flavobacterium sp.]
MKTKLVILLSVFLFSMSYSQKKEPSKASFSAPKVLFADDYLTATMDKIFQKEGIEVINTQPTYMEINLGDDLKIPVFIDVDGDKQFLIFNGSNALKEETPVAKAKELVSDINSQTNFIKAGYDEEKNLIEFRYYFWIKDGFTEKSLVSALEMYRLAYVYTFSLDKEELLK